MKLFRPFVIHGDIVRLFTSLRRVTGR